MSDQFVQLDLVDPVLGEVDLEGVPQGHHLELRELVLLKREMYLNNFSSDRQSLYLLLRRLLGLFLVLLRFLLIILAFFWLEKSNGRYEVPEKSGSDQKKVNSSELQVWRNVILSRWLLFLFPLLCLLQLAGHQS